MARTSFTFRLQRLLEIREMREKAAQQELIVLRHKLQDEEVALTQLIAEGVRLHDSLTMPVGRVGNLQQLQNERDWTERAIKDNAQAQVNQKRVIVDAENAVAAQQEVVKQRGIEVKALDKLREKQREEHRIEQLREEGLFLDDLAGQGFLRRRTQAQMIEQEDQEARDAASGKAAEA